jgi:uncharacterized protein (TIGR00251 family)
MKDCIRQSGGRIFLDIRAQPGASKTCLGDIAGGRLKVRIAAAAEDGRANAELLLFFAKLSGAAKRDIVLESGEKSRLKTISFPAELLAKIEHILEN